MEDILSVLELHSYGYFDQQSPYNFAIGTVLRSLACLLHFLQSEVRKSGNYSSVLLDIKGLTLELKMGPHSALLGHNAFEVNVA